jgi:hypothetical protein
MRGIRGQRSGIRERRKAELGRRNCCLPPFSPLPSPLSPLPSPLAPPSGISLMEVLISIGLVLGGLMIVAMTIPIGKLSLVETNKADRTGACGRAALREVKVRGMLSSTVSPALLGTPLVFVVDPLYYAANGSAFPLPSSPPDAAAPNMGGVVATPTLPAVQRVTFGPLRIASTDNTVTIQTRQALADNIFGWRDELKFALPEEIRSGAPPAGTRPIAVTDASTGVQQSDGNFSWFLTVAPSLQSGTYAVSAVVCYKRVLTQTRVSAGVYQPDGEETTDPATFAVTTTSGPVGYGGVSIQITDQVGTTNKRKWPLKWDLKSNDWVLLYGTSATAGLGGTPTLGQATWYRVVHAGFDGTNTNITLAGPDWYGGDGIISGTNTFYLRAVSVQGVTGVYTATMQLN